jgi:hypothetical protein
VIVFVVLWANYGDQGVDFCGVYSTKEKAQALGYNDKRVMNEMLTTSPADLIIETLR